MADARTTGRRRDAGKPRRPRRRLRAAALALALAVLSSLGLAGPARAASRIFWTNAVANKISYANLDGSGGGGDLDTSGASPVEEPEGVGIDAATGRIYWDGHNGISFANLSGGGGGDLSTGAATVSGPFGIAIDPLGGRVYWTNNGGMKIAYANLDGSGGNDLNTGSASLSAPLGPAVDRAAGKICWSNSLPPPGTIACANLDGSGGGDLNTGTAPVQGPVGVAIDEATGRIYWANSGTIGFANVDGSGGGGELKVGAATLVNPYGLAIDPVAGRIYWANNPLAIISWAKLDNSNVGEDLNTTGATASPPFSFPAILKAPFGSGPPAISGAATVGATLTCSAGSWAADPVGAHLSWAPSSFAYAWQRDGAELAGAGGATLSAALPGSYTCRVTASDAAGSSAQTSAPHRVSANVQPPPNTRITRSKIRPAKGKAVFRFAAVGQATGFQCRLKRRHPHARKKARFHSCRSPKTYRHLGPGTYLFEVRGVGPAGADPTPAKRKFEIG
jgi:hypothetical protein